METVAIETVNKNWKQPCRVTREFHDLEEVTQIVYQSLAGNRVQGVLENGTIIFDIDHDSGYKEDAVNSVSISISPENQWGLSSSTTTCLEPKAMTTNANDNQSNNEAQENKFCHTPSAKEKAKSWVNNHPGMMGAIGGAITVGLITLMQVGIDAYRDRNSGDQAGSESV